MLKRKIQKDIIEWINNGKDALLVTGVRQAGKSFLIRETLKQLNKDYVEFNFIRQPKLLNIFKPLINEDVETFIQTLSIASKKTLKKDTIIFFDEIQECKEILTIIKFLVEKGKYKYVLSGSLLGVELNDLRSAPVGYLTTIDMYPMDLEEFYIANGLSEEVITNLKKCLKKKEKVDEFIHNSLIDAFYKYLIVGGMPEAVQVYVDSGDLNLVMKVHEKIKREYKRDFTKYEKEGKLKLINTYDLIPSQLNEKNKRYKLSSIEGKTHYEKYEESFIWLKDAGVALPTYNVTDVNIPLQASSKSNLFKLFLSDTGMLTTSYGSSTILKLLSKDKDINCGSIFENFVAQELNSKGFELYYYNNKSHGEIDFIIEHDNEVLPIEVKSGKSYQVHSALSYFSKTLFNKGIVLSTYNVSVKDNIIYLPIYMLMFIEKNIKIEDTYKIDLSNLK